MKALSIAATGMSAQQLNLEVIANNIANINTTGFKRARAEFSDLLYQTERMQGVPSRANQAIVPEGANVGLGVKAAAVRNLHIQGPMNNTGNKLDVALVGKGWFEIEGTDGEPLYTRAGSFNTNATGQLVTTQGYNVNPAIVIPEDAVEVVINKTGQVFARIDGQAELQDLASSRLPTSPMKPVSTRLATICSVRLPLPEPPFRACRAIRLRRHRAGLSRRLQCGPREGNHRADLGTARLRDELEGHPRGR